MTPPRPPFRIAAYIAIGLLAYHVLTLLTPSSGNANEVTHTSEALLKLGAKFWALDSTWRHSEAMAARRDSIARAHYGTATHAASGDSATVATAKTGQDSLTALVGEVGSLRTAVGTANAGWGQCEMVRASCEQRADSAESRVRQLETSLRAQVAVGQCRMLFVLPCLSREAAFVLGAVATEGARIAVGKP